MVTVTIGGKKLAGFDEPIAMLMDCHRRIEHFLSVLSTAVDKFGTGILPPEGRRALETSLEYFANAAVQHTADEEKSLFPRLSRCEDPIAIEALNALCRLEQDHRRAAASHTRIEELGRQWLDRGCLDPSDRITMQALLAELTRLYSAHIRCEDELVFVHASRLLNKHQLLEIGREMRERRFIAKLSGKTH